MANTTNFGWETPDDTDLVKDGALAMRTLGNAIDASLVDLKGGTTGQILSKNSNTDMDFVWITNDQGDITGITAGVGISGGGTSGTVTVTNSMADAITAKGDLIPGTGADTFTRLAVGANGTVLTADSGETTGLKWATPAASGLNPNLIINGSFVINQRNYSSGTNLASGSFGFDRWKSGFTNTSLTFTSAPNGQEVTISTSGVITQIVERANIPSGNYVLSWSGTATGRIYNSGASAPSYASSPITFTADGSANVVVEFTASGSSKTLSNVKLEAGSTATGFCLAGGNIAGELEACQRYYWRVRATDNQFAVVGNSVATTNDRHVVIVNNPTTMRVVPTAVDYSGMRIVNVSTSVQSVTAPDSITITTNNSGTSKVVIQFDKTGAGFSIGDPGWFSCATTNDFFGLSAEL